MGTRWPREAPCSIPQQQTAKADAGQTNTDHGVYQERTQFSQTGGGAAHPENGQAPQYFVPQTACQTSPSSMEASAQVVKKSPRPCRLCPVSTGTRSLTAPRGPRGNCSLLF